MANSVAPEALLQPSRQMSSTLVGTGRALPSKVKRHGLPPDTKSEKFDAKKKIGLEKE